MKLHELTQDVRLGIRRLLRAPTVTAGVVVMFGLGLGASGVVFGVLDRLVIAAPDHVDDPASVIRFASDRYYGWLGERRTMETFSYPDFESFRTVDQLEGVTAYAPIGEQVLGKGDSARKVRVELVTGDFFSLLGVEPRTGRLLDPRDDRRGGPAVAVLSHGLWDRAFGRDPAVLGRVVELAGGSYEIIGVTPAGFTGVNPEPVDVWLPLHEAGPRIMDNEAWFREPGWTWLRPVARLARGASRSAAADAATGAHLATVRDLADPGDFDPSDRVLVLPLVRGRGPLASGEARVASWLGILSVLVLLIVCANVANLLLARALRERRRLAVQIALGVGRARLMRQVLVEALLLAGAGGAAAAVVTWVGADALRSSLLSGLAWTGPALGDRVILFLAAAVVITGLAAGLAPAIQASRPDVLDALREGARSASGQLSRTRQGLLTLQTALSVVLLIGAGLFVRSLQEAVTVDLGFDPGNVFEVDLTLDTDVPGDEARRLHLRASERFRGIPGVAGASVDLAPPFGGSYSSGVYFPGRDSVPTPPGGGPYIHMVEPDYFRLMGLEMEGGRALNAGDGEGAPPVVVVNRAFSRAFWPGVNPIGECFRIGSDQGPCARVVGVVEDAHRSGIVEEPSAQYYVTPDQNPGQPRTVLVRADGGDPGLLDRLRREAQTLDPGVRYADVRPLERAVTARTRSWRLGATLLSAFGLLALTVAAVGLYALLSFTVAQRKPELAIRAALGAGSGRLVRLVVDQALRLLLVGIGIGVAAAWVAAPSSESLLYRVDSRDPWIFGTVALVLLVSGLLASLLPAVRAARSDPASALRAR